MRKLYYKCISEILARYWRTPQYIILFVSNECWTKCSHCWFNESYKENHLDNSVLSLQEIELIAKSIKKIKFLSITGGEAFLRDDIDEITGIFAKNTRLSRMDIPTSGFDTDKVIYSSQKIIKKLDGIPFRVNVSLDGPSEIHDKIRNRTGSFNNAIITLTELLKLKKVCNTFDVAVISTISNQNENYLEELFKIIMTYLPEGEWMINYFRGTARSSDVKSPLINNYVNANNIVTERNQQIRLSSDKGYYYGKLINAKNSLRRKIIIRTVAGERKGGGCMAGSFIGVIHYNGKVMPCEMLTDYFGNLRDNNYNLKKIWNNTQAKEFRKKIQNHACICTHECFLSASIPFQPASVYKLLSEFGNKS